jgi:hypothetical protein
MDENGFFLGKIESVYGYSEKILARGSRFFQYRNGIIPFSTVSME